MKQGKTVAKTTAERQTDKDTNIHRQKDTNIERKKIMTKTDEKTYRYRDKKEKHKQLYKKIYRRTEC